MIFRNLVRLNGDGSTDTSFDVGTGLDGPGRCVARGPGGRVLVGGEFTEVNGVVCERLAVLDEAGNVLPEVGGADGEVRCLLVQTDGKVLVGGAFTEVAGVARARLARLKEDLTVEAAFSPEVDGTVHAGALQADGGILAAGAFTMMNEVTRGRLGRMFNDETASLLKVESAGRVTWRRTGGGPEVEQVRFDLDLGAGYGPLGGTVVRTVDGWEVTGLELDGAGNLRARAFPTDGHGGSLMEEVVAFDFVPVMEVSAGGLMLTSGGELDFGELQVGLQGEVTMRTVSVRNVGLAVMTLDAVPVVLDEVNGDQWEIVSQPDVELMPGEATEFGVRFKPTSVGSKPGGLRVGSDVAGSPFVVNLRGVALAGPGSVDKDFQVQVTGEASNKAGTKVMALAVGSGVMMAGGSFATVNAQNRKGYVRFFPGEKNEPPLGSLLPAMLPQTGAGVNQTGIQTVVQLLDGKWMVGGTFTSVNGVLRYKRLARLNADGSVDTTFKMPVNEDVTCLLAQADGGVIVGGAFTKMDGETRAGLGRITPEGTLDMRWNPKPVGGVTCLGTQADGKVYVGGTFTSMAGTTRRKLARLNVDGSVDAGFDAGLSLMNVTSLTALTVDAEGRVLVGLGTSLQRLNVDGTVDEDFTPMTGMVRSVALQADGGVVIGRSNVAQPVVRLLRDGTVDGSFVNQAERSEVLCVALAPTGEVYACGDAIKVEGQTRHLVRFINQPTGVANVLSVVSETEVRWLRGGTVPEAAYVVFDLSEDGGTVWRRLGTGVRMEGGWGLAGSRLPGAGLLRGRACVTTGNRNSAFHEEVVSFGGLAVPDLQIEGVQGLGNPTLGVLEDEGLWTFPGTLPGQQVSLTLTLRNTGKATLTGLTVSCDAMDWVVTSLGLTTLAVNQATQAVVRFTPQTTGDRNGVLTVRSNVPGSKMPYTLRLSGAGVMAPVAYNLGEAGLTSVGVRLKGRVKPNHSEARAFFEYKRVADAVWIRVGETTVAGFKNVDVSHELSGLLPSTSYHYRVGIYSSVNGPAAVVYAPKTGGNGFTTMGA